MTLLDKQRSNMKRYAKYIGKPRAQSKFPYHPVPGEQMEKAMQSTVFVDEGVIPGAKLYGRTYTLPPLSQEQLNEMDRGMEAHVHHEADEVHVVLGEQGAAKVRWILGDESYLVESPYTVFIPANVRHHIEWLAVNKPVRVIAIITKGKYP